MPAAPPYWACGSRRDSHPRTCRRFGPAYPGPSPGFSHGTEARAATACRYPVPGRVSRYNVPGSSPAGASPLGTGARSRLAWPAAWSRDGEEAGEASAGRPGCYTSASASHFRSAKFSYPRSASFYLFRFWLLIGSEFRAHTPAPQPVPAGQDKKTGTPNSNPDH